MVILTLPARCRPAKLATIRNQVMPPSPPSPSDALRQAFIAGALAMREAALLAAEEVKPRQSRHTGEQYAPEDFVNAIGDIDPKSLIPA